MRIVGGSAALPDLPRVSPAATVDRAPSVVSPPTVVPMCVSSVATESFDVGKNIILVPHFVKLRLIPTLVPLSALLCLFVGQRIAGLCYCNVVLMGKALEVFSTLP